MNNVIRALALVCAVLMVTGCANRRASRAADTAPPTSVAGQPDATTSAAGAPAGADGSAVPGTALESAGATGSTPAMAGPTEGLLGRRIIYFDFDRDDIRADDRALVAAHAQYLASNPGVRIRLEGHTDERGTREYNIGLAERRAQAVRRALTLEGARDNQAQTVSFGEERPATAGEDEAAYAQNRRVEIVYGN